MLNIINNLIPFFEDCYRRINVREYAKIIKVSPPTASKILKKYEREGLLKKEEDRGYLLFFANKDNKELIDLSRIYWKNKLDKITKEIDKKMISPTIILFGSLSKAETKQDSDIDLALFGEKKKINFKKFEKELKREIQIFWFKSINEVKDKTLLNNIVNGYTLKGELKL